MSNETAQAAMYLLFQALSNFPGYMIGLHNDISDSKLREDDQ